MPCFFDTPKLISRKAKNRCSRNRASDSVALTNRLTSPFIKISRGLLSKSVRAAGCARSFKNFRTRLSFWAGGPRNLMKVFRVTLLFQYRERHFRACERRTKVLARRCAWDGRAAGVEKQV